MYTKDLIDSTIFHFKEKYDMTLSEETAESYLKAMVDLFEAFRELLQEQQDLKDENGLGMIAS